MNSKVAGSVVGHFIEKIINITGANPLNFHIVGFSLGAHVAGFAGKILNERNKIGRITGSLDLCLNYA